MKAWTQRPADVPKSRNNNFNLLRFAAACMVIYGHMYSLMGVAEIPNIGSSAIHNIGVSVLFLISGFLIYESWQRDPHILRYAVRRALRLWPALIVLCLLTALVMGPLVTSLPVRAYFADSGTWKYIVNNILLRMEYNLPGVFAENPYSLMVNRSLWTMPVEALMYAALAALLFVLRKPRAQKIGLVCAAAALTAFRLLCIRLGWEHSDVFFLAHYFFIGALFSFPHVRRLLNTQAAIVALLLLAARPGATFLGECAFLLLLPYVVFSFALPKRAVFAGLFTKNDYSYGLYLYAFPVQQLLIPSLLAHGVDPLAGAVLTFTVTLLLAAFSWHLVESHAQRLSKWICAKLAKRSQPA